MKLLVISGRVQAFSVVCLLISFAHSLPKDEFFSFGPDYGDTALNPGDDTRSEEVSLRVPIVFYNNHYYSVYVGVNGVISFDDPLEIYRSDFIIPNRERRKIIAPFFADVDTTLSGNVYYREMQDETFLYKARNLVRNNYPRSGATFEPTAIFMVTWVEVAHFDKGQRVNTFQLVIASDGDDSYSIFNYADDGIKWVIGDGKDEGSPDVPAQVGVDAGDQVHHTTLAGSGTEHVEDIAKTSNVLVPGVWMLRIGRVRDAEVPASRELVDEEEPRSCEEGGREQCSNDAQCEDYDRGFCCHCPDSMFGSGRVCMSREVGMFYRINGYVTGTLNNVNLDDLNVELHSFSIPSDPRVQVAFNNLPRDLTSAVRSLFTITNVLGWLFGNPHSTRAVNGMTVTGGFFDHEATVRYEENGDVVTIRQSFTSPIVKEKKDWLLNPNVMKMRMTFSGSIPLIEPADELYVDKVREIYSRASKGVITSKTKQEYQVGDVTYTQTTDQRITYRECEGRPLDDLQPTILVADNPTYTLNTTENIMRSYFPNSISTLEDGDDPCRGPDVRCHEDADCTPDGSSYRCSCKAGFEGDGHDDCRDINECERQTYDCSPNARCRNSKGSYDCLCVHGYIGDGKECRPVDCNTVNNCGGDADCVQDEETSRYECRCRHGYSGDGFTCELDEDSGSGDGEDSCANSCDRNARCVLANQHYICRCNHGYSGDGKRCRRTPAEVCVEDIECDGDARCLYVEEKDARVCVCNPGYIGDGRSCTKKVEPCNRVNNCHVNAECIYDEKTNSDICRCRPGYDGNGYSCTPITDNCRRNPNVCDSNAYCKRSGNDYICECNRGYVGDGTRCTLLGADGDVSLLFSQEKVILQIPLVPTKEDRGHPIVLFPNQTIIGVDFDCDAHEVYWTDITDKAIYRAKLDGSGTESLVNGLASPEDLAVDWISRNLYWTDSGMDKIQVSRLDGTSSKTLITANVSNPRSIQVDPMQGAIFWTDWYRASPKIERALMDGTQRRSIVTDHLGLPNGLVLDYRTQRICWIDAGTKKIECSDYNGGNRKVIFTVSTYPYDLTYANDIFYWTDWNSKKIQNVKEVAHEAQQANMGLDVPFASSSKLYGITIVRNHCYSSSNACSRNKNNGGCRFLCLPGAGNTRTCACPDDISEEECNTIPTLI